jgi:hypothetical protein
VKGAHVMDSIMLEAVQQSFEQVIQDKGI